MDTETIVGFNIILAVGTVIAIVIGENPFIRIGLLVMLALQVITIVKLDAVRQKEG